MMSALVPLAVEARGLGPLDELGLGQVVEGDVDLDVGGVDVG